jgi:hypothetical protein
MAYFQTKNTNLGKFWRVLQWKMVVYFMGIWSILLPFGLFRGHLVQYIAIWYIFPVLVCRTCKSGNPGLVTNVYARFGLEIDNLECVQFINSLKYETKRKIGKFGYGKDFITKPLKTAHTGYLLSSG